jgi:hypothetical protein
MVIKVRGIALEVAGVTGVQEFRSSGVTEFLKSKTVLGKFAGENLT